MKNKMRVGIDLGSKNIRILVARLSENSNHPTIVTGGIEQSDGIRNGRIISKLDAVKALKKLIEKTERELGEKIENVNVAITGDFTKTKVVKTKNTVSKASNEVSELDLEKARSEVINTIPINSPFHILNVSLSEVKLDGKIIRGSAMHSIGGILETTQIIHLIPKKILEEYIALFDELEINIKEIVLSSVISYIPVTKRSERIAGIGILNIGHDNTTFTYFENELPIIMKNWAIGGSNITNDIALILQTKIEDAENIKKDFLNLKLKKVSPIINARLEDIADLVKKELRGIQDVGKIPGGIILIGGSARIEEIENTLKKSLNMQVTNGNKILQEITKHVLKDSAWAVAYGLTYLEDKEKTQTSIFVDKIKAYLHKLLNTISP